MTALLENNRPTAYRRAPHEKRELLLAAARELFDEQGYEHTSTMQIARRAGVSEGILFHHFGNKRKLLGCVAEEFARAAAAATMPADATDLTEEMVVRSAFDFAESHPGLYQLLSNPGGALVDPDMVGLSEIVVQAIKQKLERAMREGLVRQGDPHIMAQLQFAVVEAAYRAWRGHGDPAHRGNSKEDYIAEAIRCMQAMLAPVPGMTQATPQTDNQGDDHE